MGAVRVKHIRIRTPADDPHLVNRAQQPTSRVRLGANAARPAVLSTCSSNRGSRRKASGGMWRAVSEAHLQDAHAQGSYSVTRTHVYTGAETAASGCESIRLRAAGSSFVRQEETDRKASSSTYESTPPKSARHAHGDDTGAGWQHGSLGGQATPTTSGDAANAQGDPIAGKKNDAGFDAPARPVWAAEASLPRLRWPRYIRCESNGLHESIYISRHPSPARM